MQLDETQLASRAGTGVAMVRRLRDLGILPADGELDSALVPRVRFAVRLEQSGVTLDSVAQAITSGDLSIEFVDRTFYRVIGMLETTYHDLAAELGLSTEIAEAVQIALGVPTVSDESWMREDDAAAMRSLAELVRLGVDESVMIRLFQIMADNLQKMARAASEMWSEGVQQPLLEAGLSSGQMLGARSADGDRFQAIGEEIVLLLWTRYIEEEIFRGTIETFQIALEEAGMGVSREDQPPAIVFLDLTAFTHRTDQSGDEVAATAASTLVDVVRRSVVEWGGTLVKMLGDGAMLHFHDAAAAVRCSLELVDTIAAAGLAPGRFGIAAGPLIVRDVDYYGQTVNVAARLVDYARPREVLVSSDVVEAVDSNELIFTLVGPASFKGVTSLVTVSTAELSPR